jgi:hypothetical protein
MAPFGFISGEHKCSYITPRWRNGEETQDPESGAILDSSSEMKRESFATRGAHVKSTYFAFPTGSSQAVSC